MKEKNTQINLKYTSEVSDRYTQSLIKSGYPSNTHVYELNAVFLESKFPRREALFLAKMKKFYSTLPFMEKAIFLNDYLEKGKNYPFWWLAYGNEEFINKERRKLECKLRPKIKYLLAE